MVKKAKFRNAARKAIKNVINHGDTDIFPFPFGHHAFFDEQEKLLELIVDYDDNFIRYLAQFSPLHVSSLTPVTYSGFRWATQLDPIWNAYFLSCVLSIWEEIEDARLPRSENVVFSYRISPDPETGDLFDRDFSWFQFMQHSIALSELHEFVVVCDISEFYPRLGHHKLENALKQVAGNTSYPKKIMNFLSNYSSTKSFGLPIGGPASRILSELTINQIDRLLKLSGFVFTRFADDYHLFSNSKENAYKSLIFLSEKLFDNQGLSLQKSKTRIMTSAEFRSTNPLKDGGLSDEPEEQGEAAARTHTTHRLLRFSLRFDPYSPTAEEDYEHLREEIKKFDIVSMLKEELAKSRVHAALARKIVTAIRFLDGSTKDDAVLSILDNCEVLYSIFSSVLTMIDQVYEELSPTTQHVVIEEIQRLISSESHVLRVDVHLGYAVRVLSHANTPDNQALLQQIYESRTSSLIRRDVIITMTRWGEWSWLSDKKNRFRELTPPERRALIVASYILRDEGSHWRSHIKRELSPFEIFILDWAAEKSSQSGWVVSL